MWEDANGVCEKYQILCGKCQNEGSGFKSLGSFAFFSIRPNVGPFKNASTPKASLNAIKLRISG